MPDTDGRTTAVGRTLAGLVARWLDLGRGWQAVVLGVSIVFASHILA